jgi:hypothetical protein
MAGSSNGGAGGNHGGASGGQGASGSSPLGGSGGGVPPAGEGAQAGSDEGGGGAGPQAEPCANPVDCIDEVAGTPSDFGNPGWKDSWWVTGCSEKNDFECIIKPSNSCMTADAPLEQLGSRTVETWQLGGEKGQHYKVTFRFSGIVEGKSYTNGSRDVLPPTTNIHAGGPYDMFYRDGKSVASNYEVLKLTIFDDEGREARHFYMNAGDGSAWEQHATFLASYEKSIVVIGQGKVEHLVQDANCRAIDNCGPGSLTDATCPGPRKLPGEDGNLMLPPKYKDPSDGFVKDTRLLAGGYPGATLAQPWHAHASHLKIVAIEKTSDGVDKNY